MLNVFKKLFSPQEEAKPEFIIYAPFSGKVVPIEEVNDPVFSEKILGPGVAILPDQGDLHAPLDGKVSTLFDTGHAVSVSTADGLDILMHIGLETVGLEGQGFDIRTTMDADVKKGDLLIKADLAKIQELGCEIITPVLITNADEFGEIEILASGEVKVGDPLMKIAK